MREIRSGREQAAARRPFARALSIMLLAGSSLMAACAPSETEILQSAFIEPDAYPPPPDVFCYRTLGIVDCHRRPQLGEADRLMGAYYDGVPYSGHPY